MWRTRRNTNVKVLTERGETGGVKRVLRAKTRDKPRQAYRVRVHSKVNAVLEPGMLLSSKAQVSKSLASFITSIYILMLYA